MPTTVRLEGIEIYNDITYQHLREGIVMSDRTWPTPVSRSTFRCGSGWRISMSRFICTRTTLGKVRGGSTTAGAELLGPTWAIAVETASHALRLITSGLFDCFPSPTVILGHLREMLAFAVDRLQQRISHVPALCLQRTAQEYLRENFYLTTSRNFHTQSLIGALLQVGADRIMFALDYPFESHDDAGPWFDTVPISEADRLKIGRTNAQRLLRLGEAASDNRPAKARAGQQPRHIRT